MPYRIVDEGQGLYVTLKGDVSFAEIMKANAEGWEHPHFERHRYQIWDFHAVEDFELDAAHATAIARMDTTAFRMTRRMRTAFIAVRKDIREVLAVYIGAVDPVVTEARLFEDEASARKWAETSA